MMERLWIFSFPPSIYPYYAHPFGALLLGGFSFPSFWAGGVVGTRKRKKKRKTGIVPKVEKSISSSIFEKPKFAKPYLRM